MALEPRAYGLTPYLLPVQGLTMTSNLSHSLYHSCLYVDCSFSKRVFCLRVGLSIAHSDASNFHYLSFASAPGLTRE